jgi:hypothetical protein
MAKRATAETTAVTGETEAEAEPACGNCANFHPGSLPRGTCRQDSPDVDFRTSDGLAIWPTVVDTEWCSEHIAAPVEEPVSGEEEGAGAMSVQERAEKAKRAVGKRRHAAIGSKGRGGPSYGKDDKAGPR